MATSLQIYVANRSGSPTGISNLKFSTVLTLTMVAGAAVSASWTPPVGSRVSAMKSYTPTAITGSPTNINVTVGKAAAGTDYVAAVDKKGANGVDTLTLVAAPDYQSWPVSQAIFATATAVGGTNPAGTIYVEIEYTPPT